MSFQHSRTTIDIKVQPNAKRNEVVRFQNEVLHIKIAAPPVKGRANNELIGFLIKQLGISKNSITLEKGHTSRNKVISVTGLDRNEVIKRLLSGTKS
jgi:uncharacterized protein (TIGR00251 family)